MATYKGKIRLNNNPTEVKFSVEAGNPSEARKIVKSMYDMKKFLKQPSRY